MSFQELANKTAALLELQADEIDRNTQAKVAASRDGLIERLTPAFDEYERLTGEKIAEEQREEILNGGDSPLIDMLEKIAAKSGEVHGLGTPEPASRSKEAEASSVAPPPVGITPVRPKTPRRKGRRRDAYQIKQASNEAIQRINQRYAQGE